MKRLDFGLLIPIIFLSLFGILMIYDASFYMAFQDFADKYHYVKVQILWMVLGFLGLLFFSFFDYRKLYNFSLMLIVLSLVLLMAVFLPGIGVSSLGAHRWINLRFTVLQPAEFIKLTLSIYLAAWFSQKEKKRFLAFSLLIGFILALVMLEPDMGTTIVILCESFIVYFLSGGSLALTLGSIPVLGIFGYLLIKLEPYRAKRLATFFNFNESIQSSSYHVRQILIALGSGGLFGVGIGNSLQKYAYLPENITDSIFAIIGEELGLIGTTVISLIFLFVIWRGFLIAMKTKDKFGRLLSGGIISFLAVQILINIGAQTAVLPLTGIPLPFISYGGSALIVDLCSVGIVLNVAKQNL